MKILDKYILKSYLKKFFSFFLLIMLVFIFQTIWMFIDDLAGKEIDFEIIFKFLIFYCPKLIPCIATYCTVSFNYDIWRISREL